jgi:hypothetical protein
MIRFPQITLLHGKDDTPSGTVQALETALKSAHPMVQYARPLIPPDLTSAKAVEWFERFYLYRVPQDSLLVGIDRGGLIACAVQAGVPGLGLSVVAIDSPTQDETLIVDQCHGFHSRLALFSSAYEPIKGRCDWKIFSSLAYDLPWLAQGCKSFFPLAYLISAYSRNSDMDKEVAMMFPTEL